MTEIASSADKTTTRVVIAAGTRLACDAYSARVDGEGDLQVIAAPGKAANLGEALVSLAPQVVVLDPKAVGDVDLALVRQLHDLPTNPSIVALIGEGDRALATRLVRSGAAAAVLKTATGEELITAIRWAAQGAGWISPALLRDVVEDLHQQPSQDDERLRRLTAREREVLQLLVDGLGRKEIAQRLYLSVDTIRTHTRTIMEKLDVHSATAAVSVALSAGLRPRS
jgi:DNA-binding NarL/FixJ family response regulator